MFSWKRNAVLEWRTSPNQKNSNKKNWKYINKPKRQFHCNIKCILSELSKWFEQQNKSIGLQFMRKNIMYNEHGRVHIQFQNAETYWCAHTAHTMNSNSRLERYIYLKVSSLISHFWILFVFCVHLFTKFNSFGCNRDIFCWRLTAMNRWSIILKAVHHTYFWNYTEYRTFFEFSILYFV